MNVDRSAASLAALNGTGATNPSSKTSQQDVPEFSFDTGDVPKADVDARRDVMRDRSTDGNAPRSIDERPHARETARAEARSHAPDDAHADDASRVRAKAHEGPNAAARRGSRHADTDDASETSIADSVKSANDATTSAAAPTDTSTDAAPADSLPDRMLALLTGDWAASKPPAATGDATAGAGLSTLQGTATSVVTSAVGASALSNALPIDGTAPSSANTLAPATGNGASLLQALTMPTVDAASNGQSTATPATDAFAALAALAGNRTDRDAASSSSDATPPITAPAFNPLLAKGAEAPLAAVRDVVVAMPAAAPLALDADFDDGMSQRITWMADQRLDHAEVRVTPEGLGPIDIRLQMDGHRVNAQFHAAHADVRQALESGMDRLRDLLGRQGMELGQAQVGSGSRQGGDGRAASGSQAFGAGTELGGDAQPHVTTVRTLRARGIIDEYA
ncbi:flagellar hook-length control protein FliK [Cognatilysobacter terrigena]|uniref:flagellar hook-length control protein FliK n=1 Tax=Cognatilysobacter terrigena TaxID=2488749 RepID=UPI001414D01B|nr:flagellar hook-length control protein FliK [Lysobacter terrigena]